MLPLYAQISQETFKEAETAHSGLLFDKFPDGWNPSEHYQPKHRENGKLIDDKKTFFDLICNKHRQTAETHLNNNLDRALNRQRDLVNHLQGESLIVTTDWRFISGLGTAHPYETGFIWHRTLSVPYLSGSSVKGLMRAWAEQWCELSEEEKQQVTRLFGTEKTEKEPEPEPEPEPDHCGALIIFDALPTKPPKLELDILNPHYSEYYQDGKPPADYLSPKPVFFLTVAAGEEFEFFLAPRKEPKSKQAEHDLKTGLDLLHKALETLGAGGKTAVGYGIFKESAAAQRKRENERVEKQQQAIEYEQEASIAEGIKIRGYTGLSAKIYRQSHLEHWEIKNEKFYQSVPDYLQTLAQETDTEIKKVVIGIIWDMMEQKFPGIMNQPDKTKGKQNKYVYTNEKARNIAKELLRLNSQ